ncbi:MAG: cyclic nucleotide-binding domain-containing protein [Cytophagales bacterium]|nr:cyclic nucleotide-binding domain-containing protein [Cytophagales bacterium]
MIKRGLDSVLSGRFWDQREELTTVRGTVLSDQFAKADYFYLLQEGKVNLYITLEEIGKRILVGSCSTKNAPLGWSAINAPSRHATTIIVASPQAKLVRWKLKELLDYLNANPLIQLEFLQVVHEHSKKLVVHTSRFLDNTPAPNHEPCEPLPAEGGVTLGPSQEKALSMLRKSPFFEVFEEAELERFSKVIIRKQYEQEQFVCRQGEPCSGIFLLDRGDVSIYFTTRDGSQVPIRQVTGSGYLLGWLALPGEQNLLSAKVNTPSHLYMMPQEAFNTLIQEEPKLAITFYKRVLWLITVQLQTLRARLIAKKYDQEWLSIQALLQ